MTESPTEKLSFELWHHSARRCKNFPWGMSLAMFFLGLMASLGNLIINVGLESLAGTADVNYIMQLIPVIVMGALLAAFGWHTFKTVGKPVRDNFTELRGNGEALEYLRGDEWVSVPWDCVQVPKPVSTFLLAEASQPMDRPDVAPKMHGRNFNAYEISFTGSESNRPTIYFASVPYFNNKTRAYISQAEASGSDQPVEAV